MLKRNDDPGLVVSSTSLSTFAPADATRAAELKRVKALATLVLVGTLTLFVVAKLLLNVHPVFGFVAAFAEAATIGGLADWYAVVALFKRPLGLPIPHTAIIQSNQQRIAEKLGEFIEKNFLEAGPVDAKLKQIDFGAFIADWLRDRKRSEDLARFVLRLLPEAFSATESSGLMTFITRRVTTQVLSIDLAPLAAGALRGFVQEGKHEGLLDDILRAMHRTLTQQDTMAVIRDKVRAEMPTLLRLYRADKFVVNRIIASATKFFEEVQGDPKHPFRGEFDRLLLVLRRSARQRQGVRRSHRRLEARRDGAAGAGQSRPQYLGQCEGFRRTQRFRRVAGAAAATDADVRRGRRGARRRRRVCAARSTRVWLRSCARSSPSRRAACRPSSPTR